MCLQYEVKLSDEQSKEVRIGYKVYEKRGDTYHSTHPMIVDEHGSFIGRLGETVTAKPCRYGGPLAKDSGFHIWVCLETAQVLRQRRAEDCCGELVVLKVRYTHTTYHGITIWPAIDVRGETEVAQIMTILEEIPVESEAHE
jgi:hypothetical protein